MTSEENTGGAAKTTKLKNNNILLDPRNWNEKVKWKSEHVGIWQRVTKNLVGVFWLAVKEHMFERPVGLFRCWLVETLPGSPSFEVKPRILLSSALCFLGMKNSYVCRADPSTRQEKPARK